MDNINIVLTRVDNRLVHGQVGMSWVGSLKPNLILVADDTAAEDKVQQSLMAMTAEAAGVGIRFFSLKTTVETIHKASPKQYIFIVVRTPRAARYLFDNGVPIKELNIGNMHFSEGKKPSMESHVYMDDEDLENVLYLKNKGVDVYIQIAPGDKKHKF